MLSKNYKKLISFIYPSIISVREACFMLEFFKKISVFGATADVRLKRRKLITIFYDFVYVSSNIFFSLDELYFLFSARFLARFFWQFWIFRTSAEISTKTSSLIIFAYCRKIKIAILTWDSDWNIRVLAAFETRR